jgi:defect-in-organelle-trafficking protein DotB
MEANYYIPENMNQPVVLPNEPARFSGDHIQPLLMHCHALGASDITIQSGEAVVVECEGQLLKVTQRRLSNAEVVELLNSIYGPNGSAQILSGADIDTHYEFRPNRLERYRFRVNGTGCLVEGYDGIQLTFRAIPSTPPSLSSLNLEPNLIQALDAQQQGVVYVTGATGSGKSTLLAAIIRYLIEKPSSHLKINTYESPIEFVYDGIQKPNAIISQAEIPRHLPSFAAGARNALRRKPRIILIGESRDPETVESVIEAALTGHAVYTTVHSNGVAETLRRLIAAFSREKGMGPIIDIIETIRIVIWQTLVPTLEGKRIALREFLVFNEVIRNKLLDTPVEQLTAVTRQLLCEYGQPMWMDAKRKFESGLISERQFKRFSLYDA